ncbi:MAG: hypothetical protein OXN18_15405 [Gemmatimonadota bacterium]|nr:hypothetical protein [Gemmatimonadota bacterium]
MTATLLRVIGFGVIAGAAVLWALVSPPIAITVIIQTATTAGFELLAQALTALAPIILPFPLAGALAVAVLCAVATWPPHSPRYPASEKPHAR